jgi:hypothetical protein
MSLQNNPDVTYSQGRAAVWSSVEINIGIFCNTVVVLKPFLRQYFPYFFKSYATYSDNVTPGAHNTSGYAENNRQRGYVLQSLDRGEGGRVEVGEKSGHGGSGIVVMSSYKIDRDRGTDTESTEDILAPSRKIKGHYSPT